MIIIIINIIGKIKKAIFVRYATSRKSKKQNKTKQTNKPLMKHFLNCKIIMLLRKTSESEIH